MNDQNERSIWQPKPHLYVPEFRKNDSLREKRVYELLSEGKVVTGNDNYHAAMIFQHGKDSVAYGMAVKLMKKAIELETTMNRWLLAAAIDRELWSKNKPQIYGTQYTKKNEKNAKWERYRIDTTQITDEERKFYNVETLAEQKIKERNMNLFSISEYYSKSNSIEKTIKLIKNEKKKEIKSVYKVSEDAINDFGYELVNFGKINDATAIFKLNTKLYPNSFNTFDNLGEWLLKIGKKEEGLRAYGKSLELNPNNDYAKKIVNEFK